MFSFPLTWQIWLINAKRQFQGWCLSYSDSFLLLISHVVVCFVLYSHSDMVHFRRAGVDAMQGLSSSCWAVVQTFALHFFSFLFFSLFHFSKELDILNTHYLSHPSLSYVLNDITQATNVKREREERNWSWSSEDKCVYRLCCFLINQFKTCHNCLKYNSSKRHFWLCILVTNNIWDFWELFVQMGESNNHQIKLTVCFFILDLIWFLWLYAGLALYCAECFATLLSHIFYEWETPWSPALWRVLVEGSCPETQAQKHQSWSKASWFFF